MFFLSFSLALLLLLYLPLPRDLQDLIKKINVASFFACPPECNFVTQRAPIYLQSIRHGRSKYSINTRLVSSLLNLFVSRRTPLHHNSRTASPIPSYFCGRRVRPLARSLAKDFIASFVQYHFTIVFPATSSAVFPFFDPPPAPAVASVLQSTRRYSLRILLRRHKRRAYELSLRVLQRG